MIQDCWYRLGERAVACKGWRWYLEMAKLTVYSGGKDDGDPSPPVPDFEDAATVGCLLALVWESKGVEPEEGVAALIAELEVADD